jgi:hypothetical protein
MIKMMYDEEATEITCKKTTDVLIALYVKT